MLQEVVFHRHIVSGQRIQFRRKLSATTEKNLCRWFYLILYCEIFTFAELGHMIAKVSKI